KIVNLNSHLYLACGAVAPCQIQGTGTQGEGEPGDKK
ncbi:hypothetical protein BAE44_0004853, partial [Dichanthelium oligosanthes]